jgi:hypothetical protein
LGNISGIAAAIATGTMAWNALELPTMGFYGSLDGATAHFQWTVTTEGVTSAFGGGWGPAILAENTLGLGTPLVTGVPVLFPLAAAMTTRDGGVTAWNCFTAMFGAARRGLLGF